MADDRMPAHGAFCWNELGTHDPQAAKHFYTALLGWQFKEGDVTPTAYSEIVVGGRPVGGIYGHGPEAADAATRWIPYVAVEDVDASARRVWELGGKVCLPPTDIPNVGRFCVVEDPTGATISLITLQGSTS